MHKILESRLLTRENFLREAYNIPNSCVRMEQLTCVDIARLRRELVKPQRTRPKKNSSGHQEMSPNSKRRLDDNLFVPPIPIPTKFVEVTTMENESKQRQQMIKIVLLYFYLKQQFLMKIFGVFSLYSAFHR